MEKNFHGVRESDAQLLTVGQASTWATERLGRAVTPSNISYLVQYGRIPKVENGGALLVKITDLEKYYFSWERKRESSFKRRLGDDLNWHLSFEQFKEAETTKHVHRLHPYKGKFIPQLVEYFLDSHTDEFKREACFAPGDIVLDPFCGSGTTLVQANELGLHAVGIDVSLFNTMISNLKLSRVSAVDLVGIAKEVERKIAGDAQGRAAREFENELLEELRYFNGEFFPSPQYKIRVRAGEIDEDKYGAEKEREFLPKYKRLLKKHGINNAINQTGESFVTDWYLPPIQSEIRQAKKVIDNAAVADGQLRDLLRMVLSRTVRSSRATTHYDLATLIRPVTETYYCSKHGKVCKPIFSMLGWWRRYAEDTVKRIAEFEKIRTDTAQICLTGDSRRMDIFAELQRASKKSKLQKSRCKIRGIFSSPPYVGLIDYHEQHAYAYELFGLPRNDGAEIGPLSKGRGRAARQSYTEGVAQVLLNCKKYMVKDYDTFLVANDKFGLYPRIAQLAGMKIVKEYRRPVLNRSEGDKGAYAETIFHLKEK